MKKETKSRLGESRLSVGELPKRGCASVTELGAVWWSRSWFRSPRPTLSTRRVDSADGLPRCYLMQWVGSCPNPLLSSRILGLLAARGSSRPPRPASPRDLGYRHRYQRCRCCPRFQV